MKAIKTAVIAAAVTYLTIITAGTINPAWVGVTTTGAVAAAEVAALAFGMSVVTGVGTLLASGVGMLTSRGLNATGQNFGTKIAGRDAQAPRQIVYGECRVGGTIVKLTTSGTSNYKLHLAIALAGHEIESLEAIYYNDELLTATSGTVSGETVYTVTNSSLVNTENTNAFGGGGLVRYTFHDGSQTTVDGLANAAVLSDYPSTCKFQGIAYVYMEVVYDPEKNSGLPNLWFQVRGKKVYDPRTTSTAYSNNPALIIRDYLSDTLYGLKAQSSEINDLDSSGGFYAAADICDQTVNLPSGTEKRYTTNGFTNASASGDGLLEGLLSSCSGSITYTNGQFNLFVGGDRTATLTITDEDLLGPVSVSTRGSSGDLYNVVKSIFVDSTAKYEAMESPVYEDATFLAADTPSGESSANYKRILEMQLPFTSTNTMAQRLHTIGLIRQRQTASISILSTVEYLKLQPSDWVNVTNSRLGYSAKTFEVVSTTLEFLENEGSIFAATRLNLQEIDDTVYDYDAADYLTPIADGSNPAGGSKAIEAPQNLALAQINAQEGTTSKISVQVSWTNRDDDAIQGVEIQYRLSTDAADAYKAAGQAGRGLSNVVFAGAVVGDQYYVRVRHFSFDNVVSGWTSPVNITIAEPDTITAPTSVSASTGRQGYIEIGFTAPAVDSVSSVNIYFSTSSGFTPSAGNLLTSLAVNKGNVRTHNVGLANGLDYGTTYYFKLTALNNYSSESSASAQVSGSFNQVDTADIVNGAIDVAKFASSIEPVTLVTSVPSTKSTETIYNTTDNILYRWDGSAYVSVQGATDFSELTGTIDTAQIANAAITAIKLGTAAVEAGKIAANAVTTDKIAALAVNADKIASNAITTAKIADDAVTSAQLADNAATEAVIATNAITATKISNGAIETAKLAAGAVTAAKITAGTITASEIASATIVASNIATGTITANKIAANTITASNIATGTITANEILSGTITATQIAASTITASKIAANTITASQIAAGAISATEIAAGAITTAKLAALAITADKIAANTITAAKIATGAITANEIAANTITAGQIAAGAISATELAADSVSVSKLVSNTAKTYSGFQFEMGTNTLIADLQGAGIFRTGTDTSFAFGCLANANNSIGLLSQQAYNGSNAYAGGFANSIALGGTTHRTLGLICNNTRGGYFLNISTGNLAELGTSSYAIDTNGDVYVDGDITAAGTITPFTGMHDGLIDENMTADIGDILVDSSIAVKLNVSNTIANMALSSAPNQPSAIGIYSGIRSSDYVPVSLASPADRSDENEEFKPVLNPANESVVQGKSFAVVNSLGEGQVNVCNEGGNIVAGDLIVTSSVVGKGMKQSDDIVRSYTVAKARESVTFTDASDIRQIACIYLCG